MTLRWPGACIGREGTITLHPWATRTEVIAHLRGLIGTPDGVAEEGLIMFFSLEAEIIDRRERAC